MDLLRTAMDRFADEKIAQRIWSHDCFLICKTLSVSVCSRSIADLVRSGHVFTDIYCRGSVKDERDATRTSRMGLGTIRTLMDEPRMRYRRAIYTEVRMDFTEKSNCFNFSIMS